MQYVLEKQQSVWKYKYSIKGFEVQSQVLGVKVMTEQYLDI